MPTCRRKRVVLTEPCDTLVQAAKSYPNQDVYYLEETGEIFDSYDAYAARMSFYRLKQFQCEVTGKSGLDYFQAVESERQEARTMHSRFSEPLKPAILRAVQWQVMGRLDHLVEAVYDRFKDRYFEDEKVVVDILGTRYHARIQKVYPPKVNSDTDLQNALSQQPTNNRRPHMIGGDLGVPAKEINSEDDPIKYYYTVQLLELEKDKSHDKHKKFAGKEGERTGSITEVQSSLMSRDRLSFSKSILRRFIRDCVDRDAAVASPWTVKPAIAKRYGVDSVMPEETRKGVENIKKGEIDKRKKVWEDKEGPPAKKKKLSVAQEEKAAERKEREIREKVERQKEEADRLAAEKKRKKPIRYPTEDLDVRLSDKEKKAGMKVQKPVPCRTAIPFHEYGRTFELFLHAWNFLVVYGQPLHLSPFTLDEFEHALQHSVVDPPCLLLAEVHSALIYNLRTVPFTRHSAVLSLLRLKGNLGIDEAADSTHGVSIERVSAAMADVGNNWERVPLRHSEGRNGWEDALVGCLKDHATVENFPRLREILTQLLFTPESPSEPSTSSSTSRMSSPVSATVQCLGNKAVNQVDSCRDPVVLPPSPNAHAIATSCELPVLIPSYASPVAVIIPSSPSKRYHALPPVDRIAILSFMCDLAISSKAIHTHMESCEEQLTALRKEKIEVNRMKKLLSEEMNTLLGEVKDDGSQGEEVMQDTSDLSDISPSEGGSETASVGDHPKKSARPQDLRSKAQNQAHANQRKLARARIASAKQAAADHRRLDEEAIKLDRRLESIEREFRKLLGAVRVKPLGKDRFYNRLWWFDGMGSASLLGSGGVVQYGAGRLFVQGPNEFDAELLERRGHEIEGRRKEEEGENGILKIGEWAVYTELEEVEEFVAWLNPKGNRELGLKNALTKWWPHILPGMRKRIGDVTVNAKLPDARRSMRTKSVAGHDTSREAYMTWTNRRAVNST